MRGTLHTSPFLFACHQQYSSSVWGTLSLYPRQDGTGALSQPWPWFIFPSPPGRRDVTQGSPLVWKEGFHGDFWEMFRLCRGEKKILSLIIPSLDCGCVEFSWWGDTLKAKVNIYNETYQKERANYQQGTVYSYWVERENFICLSHLLPACLLVAA